MSRNDQYAPSPDPSRSHSPQHANKRRKVYRACIGCVTSKTRCEDVTSQGCLRCKTKSKVCSLVQDTSNAVPQEPLAFSHANRGWNEGNDVPLPAMTTILQKLESMDAAWNSVSQRLSLVEDSLAKLASRSPSDIGQTARTSISSAVPTQTIYRPISNSTLSVATDCRAIHAPEEFSTLVAMDQFPDVIKRGLLTLDQVDMSFQLFKHRFSSLIPIPSFLLSSTPAPAHPFVVLAILSHTSPSSAITALIEESVLMTAAGANNESIILALLILSLSPLGSETDRAPLTGFRMISLAYQAGLTLGLEVDTVNLLKRGKHRLTQPYWQDTLERVLISKVVAACKLNKPGLKADFSLTLCHSRNVNFPSLRAHLIPDHPAFNFTACISHLRAEADLVNLHIPFAANLSSSETAWLSEMPNLEALGVEWKSLAAKLTTLKRTWPPTSMLHHDSQCISFIHCVRQCLLVQRLPSPLDPEQRILGLSITGVALMRQAAIIINAVNHIPQQDLSTLPAYLVMIFAVGLMLARRSLIYIHIQHPDASNLDIKEVSLNQAEERMKALGGLASKALHLVEESSESHIAPTEFQDPMFPAPGPATLPFEFDFSSFFDAGLPDGFWDIGANGWNQA